MGLRGPKPVPIKTKILRGTLNKSRERKRLERDEEREANRRFVRLVVSYFIIVPPVTRSRILSNGSQHHRDCTARRTLSLRYIHGCKCCFQIRKQELDACRVQIR